jgi:diaminopimelate decarboxylase|tara:strand:- start:877 stop:2091 length:1215 start_codon:yes stop_codon:yes gene_type:complete
MKYKKRLFYIENVSAERIAKKFGTPSYVYSYDGIKSNINNFKRNFKTIDPLICFSVKSNSHLKILNLVSKFGLGADVVSKGELSRALNAKIKPEKIVFSGVGKTVDELKFAISKKILLINAESENEIFEIEKIAKKNNKKINIGLRLNPNTDAKTLKNISTGKKENKFGLTGKKFLELLKKYKNSRFINIICLSVHIGSQITSHVPYKKMLNVVNRIIQQSKYKFKYVDLGGGMGIKYGNNVKNLDYIKYNNLIKSFLRKNNSKIIFEPGRSIVGNTGYLISKVIYIKRTNSKNFVILDSAMNDLIRPALYGAKHRIIPSKINRKKISKRHEFVGPICETTDKFLNVINYQKINQGDVIIICDVGAYGMVLSSNYNLRPKAAEILVNKNSAKIITRRQKLNDII